jgi:hypothetical protein
MFTNLAILGASHCRYLLIFFGVPELAMDSLRFPGRFPGPGQVQQVLAARSIPGTWHRPSLRRFQWVREARSLVKERLNAG